MKLFVRRAGMIHARLTDFDIALLRMIPGLIASVGDGEADPAADRLRPQVFADDEERSAEYRRLAGDIIDAGRDADVAALADLVDSVAAGEPLSEEQAAGWMRAINHARLILGARLGIAEDGWEASGVVAPDDPHVVMLHLLSRIQQDLIGALSAAL